MKKFLKISLILTMAFVLLLSLVGCGKNNDSGTQEDTKLPTNVIREGTLSASYEKYKIAKGKMLGKITDNDDADITLVVALSPLSMIELTLLPASVCGIDESSAQMTLSFLYEDITYKEEENKYTITFKDEEGETILFVAYYDKDTESAQMEMYTGEKLELIAEYIKTAEGYAAQYYMEGEEGDFLTYRIIFTETDVVVGILESQTAAPSSIYKGNGEFADDWVKEGTFWIENKGGVTISSLDET